MHALINGIALALPGSAQVTRLVMDLKDAGLVAVHLPVTPGCQTCDPGPNHDNRSICHSQSLFLRVCPVALCERLLALACRQKSQKLGLAPLPH